MEIPLSPLILQNLTGQVSLLDIVPKFTGNYSTIYLGEWHGSLVRLSSGMRRIINLS